MADAKVRADVIANWTGNRTKDLASYMLTPLQEEADDVWHQEALRRYCKDEREKAKR